MSATRIVSRLSKEREGLASSNSRMLCATCTVVCVLLLCGCQLVDVAQFSYANASATHRWVDEGGFTTLPFDVVDEHIVMQVSLNGSEPLDFVIDSGAAATVILESQDTKLLPLKLVGEIPVSGVGNGPHPLAHIVKDTRLSLGSLRVEGLPAVYLPLSSVPFFNEYDEVYFDGVIGAPFFERFVIEIDYDQQLITFSEPELERADDETQGAQWQEIALEVQSGVPYMLAQIGVEPQQSVPVKLLVDTGYRGPVSLTPATHDEIREPQEYYSTLSQGLSGDVESKVGMLEFFELGRFKLSGLPVSYAISGGESAEKSNGLIGNEVLSRFNLVFDYANERMLVAPNQQFDLPISVDRSGLLIRPHRLGAIVKSVAGDGASEAGLKVDDIITSIDQVPVTRSSITELKRLLSSDRDTVSVCWLSADQPNCGQLSLASRFNEARQ